MSDAAEGAGGTVTQTRYEPAEIEQKWMSRWLDAGVFDADPDPDREPYTIVIPPPNVTGALHMGHALNGSIQDALIRFHRMRGYNACWLPGTDHAGIATQAVVEKKLRAEGLDRRELGREAFLDQVWKWKDQYGATIIDQFKRLGCSCDYRRERFTMDEQYHEAVLHAFVALYEKGYIYRDNYIINWDAGTMSAISDLEVENREVEDEMVEVDYPFVDGSGHITISTARPETIVADVAVAVHPEDGRYKGIVGKLVKVPFTDREVPVIADEYVDIEFGTGALKITPGHDPNDFEIGRRHNLPELAAIDFERKMTDLAGDYAGMGVDQARVAMTDELERRGLLRSREPYRHSVPHSQRSGVRIEPLISLQWFCDMSELAKPALDVVRDGTVRFIPEGARKIYFGWMENLRPWCLSRQLWWGHQLPVWYRGDEIHVSLRGPENAEEEGWVQDPDVLDTWFSSGMWDFATFGWPDNTDDLEYFHPTSVLCTARDIINLWVARMLMFSLEFLDEISFPDVYIHSVIQAPDGRRMSKSLGTGIDPLELIDKYGTDATRYGLLSVSSTQDVRFNEGKIREGRDLANKLWNASRLLIMLGDADARSIDDFAPADATRVEDRWILSRLHRTQADMTARMEEYDFSHYTKSLYHFVWNELCDWYLESVKGRLRSDDAAERAEATRTLAFVLDRTLRLVHPVLPHITEEIAVAVWGESDDPKSCMTTAEWYVSTLGGAELVPFEQAERAYEAVQSTVGWLRSLRQAADVKPSQPLVGEFLGSNLNGATSPDDLRAVIGVLANVSWTGSGDGIDVPGSISMRLSGLDAGLLKERLAAQLKTAESEVKRGENKLANEKFTARAPAELVAEERAKLAVYQEQYAQLQAVLDQL